MHIDIPIEELAIGSIALTKWRLSEQAGYDVGVPATVDLIIEEVSHRPSPQQLDLKSTVLQFGFRQALLSCGSLPPRDRFILEYLCHYPPIADEHAKNQLEGEVKRHISRKRGITPSEVNLTRESAREYLVDNGLNAYLAQTAYFLGFR